MSKLFLRILSITSLVLLSSCSSWFGPDKPEPVLLTMNIITSEKINPSQLSAGNPVVVSVYQLTKIDTFESAQTLDLFQQDATILAETLIQKNTLPSLLPNDKKTITLTILPGTKYLAVFAQFSNYSQAKTKAWLNLSKLEEIENIKMSIDSITVNMFATPKESLWPW